MRILVLFVATGGGSGYLPIAPGTWGSAVGVLLWAALLPLLAVPMAAYSAVVVAVSALGWWAADRAESLFERRDDGRITVDEVAGMLLALAYLPLRWDVALAGFLLFRALDIWKPWPARAAERLPGGLGVMADDLVAGAYANLVGQVIWRLLLPGGIA